MTTKKRFRAAFLLLAALALEGCGARQSIVGNYRYVGALPIASLSIAADGHYRVCVPENSCERDTYTLELSQSADFEYDRIYFHGPQMMAMTGGGTANVDYSGFRCPCILFEDPDSGARFELHPADD